MEDVVGRLEGLQWGLQRVGTLLTALDRRSADRAMAVQMRFVRGENQSDVWYRADPGWVIVRSDGSGQYRRHVPEGEPFVDENHPDEQPVSDRFLELARERARLLGTPIWSGDDWVGRLGRALDPDHFLHWFPGIVAARLDGTAWSELGARVDSEFEKLALTGRDYAPVVAVLQAADAVPDPVVHRMDDAVAAAVQEPPFPNPEAVVQLVAGVLANEIGAQPFASLVEQSLGTADELKEAALDARNDDEHGTRLRNCMPRYLAASRLAEYGAQVVGTTEAPRLARLATVAEERHATAWSALGSWFEGSDGERTPFYRQQLRLIYEESGRRAAERRADALIERLWFFPRVHRDVLLTDLD